MTGIKTAFSTTAGGPEASKPDRLLQPSDDVRTLQNYAELALPIMKKIAAHILKMADNDLYLLQKSVDQRIKTEFYSNTKNKSDQRILTKAEDEYNGRPARVTDIVRGSTWLNNNDQIAALCVVYENLEKTGQSLPCGGKIIKFENRFEKPTSSGHMTGRALVKFPLVDKKGKPVLMENGEQAWFIGEQQVRHVQFDAEIEKAKKDYKTSHGNYRALRSLQSRENLSVTDGAALASLFVEGRTKHTDAAKKYGLHAINFNAFRKLYQSETSPATLAKAAAAGPLHTQTISNSQENFDFA